MILEAARRALGDLFTPEFRAAFFKSLGLTLLLLVLVWLGLQHLFDAYALPWIGALLPGFPSWASWLGIIAALFAAIGLALGLALLIAPVAAVIAAFLAVPVVNLLTPLFAAALMVHLHKMVSAGERRS
jgi:CysZ protein